jgi:hypothetical protein
MIGHTGGHSHTFARPDVSGATRMLSVGIAVLLALMLGPRVGPTTEASTRTDTIRTDYRLSATALIMGGTGQPLIIPPDSTESLSTFLDHTNRDFITPSGLCVGGDPQCALVAVYTPEQLGPLTGLHDMTLDQSVAVGRANLDNCIRGIACTATSSPYVSTGSQVLTDSAFVVFGESQSANISTYEKAYLIAHPPTGRTVSFDLTANPNRPNGGLVERFVGAYIPFVGITFNGATQTNSPQPTPLTTVDVARQYDGWPDFPTNPLNLLADVNALLGATFLHPYYRQIDAPPLLQGYYQDTTYYLEPTALLPLLMPLAQIPFVGIPLTKALDPPLRVLVETGYDRTINPGQPTPANYWYSPNPVRTIINLAIAIPTGWDDAIAYATRNPANRPFGTAPQPTYGVGGPSVYTGAVDPYGPVSQSAASATTALKSNPAGILAAKRTPARVWPEPPLSNQLRQSRQQAAKSRTDAHQTRRTLQHERLGNGAGGSVAT